jgi:hypothetical protein
MTPYQLDESANAPCTRTMVGLAGCAVATVPVSKRPTNAHVHLKLLFLHSARGSSDADRLAIKVQRSDRGSIAYQYSAPRL